MSPTQRSLKYLRDAGYTVAIVEHWNSFAKKKYDLWGFDLIAVSPVGQMIFVQTTTGAHGAARLEKLDSLPTTPILKRFFRCEVHAWRKLVRSKKWEPKITVLL